MNALDRKMTKFGELRRSARIVGVCAASALLCGCLSDPIASAKVDPNSPIAAEVAKLATADKDYPSFREIPPAPTDVRPPRLYGQRADELKQARARLETETAPNTWALGNTQGFAARARADAGPSLDGPTGAQTEAFADSIRKRATPPPPANP